MMEMSLKDRACIYQFIDIRLEAEKKARKDAQK
ncbi:hypothetical protein JIMMER1_22 [Brevibacillus phage Jimmer1]|uniref:Uncharacterized protein n=4 Tax=Jimmervirus TaxID=1984788 RepID=U5P0L1_9CAUD|nr:hypothetical protein AVV10_gp024 [Brevibacillus phage Osiris]YP_009226332.1 hypothetical protein AXJ21_gp022 [Brevibacillus phage Jimmer1]YP_009606449.1 hypothetical protein FDI01_gp022 [Brevibacillus phage Jimmer2]ALA48034.1 hypothetical protein POWDER_24 [Brevibacillus phage Powder]AGY37113.1 hypothetical protein JIMMER2_22 [Brevibacillus phage Jimmer2]AGY37120.1 hypothetical protein JIMMER1_22 [Brevibacillus phage Jimmer1]ALA07411.1 hypothetical protein OSIRIS_24 [Brevibacillus phage Os